MIVSSALRPVARASHWPTDAAWLRMVTSTNVSRMRVCWVATTPVPICPGATAVFRPGMGYATAAARSTRWRVKPWVVALVMLCDTVLSARCWAMIPDSATLRPKKVEPIGQADMLSMSGPVAGAAGDAPAAV